MPRRFSEWGQAVWELQQEFLMPTEDEHKKWDMQYIGVYHESDGELLTRYKDMMQGRILNQWWDKVPSSGPPSRAAEGFEEEPPSLDVLTISDGEIKISSWTNSSNFCLGWTCHQKS